MRTRSFILLAALSAFGILVIFASFRGPSPRAMMPAEHCPVPPPVSEAPPKCVFMTVYEGVGLDSSFVLRTPEKVLLAEQRGLQWLVKAQAQDGGYGAGSHSRQDIMDPHAVSTDPATTAMVAMALMRMGNGLDQGTYSAQLKKAVEYLLKQVEAAPKNAVNVTALQGTQIQSKLGQNIDVALTAQCLSNLSAKLGEEHPIRLRVMRALNTCVGMIQRSQNSDGSVQGDGWAGVLQSSFAASALESAKAQGAEVDAEALDLARNYQKANFDVNTGSVATERAAGITLYAVSGSTRNSAAEAREVNERIAQAKKEGKLAENAPVSVDALEETGMSRTEAEKYNTAYQVFNASKQQAQDERVISGFGNNGGEEFLSFLQTGESLVIGKDQGWKNWYQQTTGRLVSIQNNDGSWNGHHCITSPVFCTATSLLILSINNDIQHLLAQGAVKYRN
ncbi:MAG: terpene cyclase/mutase family protein [Flavobacteriales bacterium]|nr:terpene cyclase/mutase family protein [Flavobacteriales bacterium]